MASFLSDDWIVDNAIALYYVLMAFVFGAFTGLCLGQCNGGAVGYCQGYCARVDQVRVEGWYENTCVCATIEED